MSQHGLMELSGAALSFRPIHPFPARMAPSLVWEELRKLNTPASTVLDPMTGSGTTVVAARSLGHRGLGFDTDPLAVLVASAWCADSDVEAVVRAGGRVLDKARARARTISVAAAYPSGADDATRDFIRYWFDVGTRRQLAALAEAIRAERQAHVRGLLWCAFSRLIIVRHHGASLAMDVSHSRPHKVYEKAPLSPLKEFGRALRTVLNALPFGAPDATKPPTAEVRCGDARSLPLKDNSVDLVITSPPYLNAIDYLRGHKFSLVWMGHQVEALREVRSQNVGTEVSRRLAPEAVFYDTVLEQMGGSKLPPREAGMLVQYLVDMRSVLSEIGRVLRTDGRAVLVVGNSTVRGTFIRNSLGLEHVAADVGLRLVAERTRPLPDNLRYLPPPGRIGTGRQLEKRMREEVVLTLQGT